MKKTYAKILLELNKNNEKHTTVKIFTVGQGLLPNKHLPRLSKNVKRYGAHTDINNIHTQRSR